jgi:hypothetical protein
LPILQLQRKCLPVFSGWLPFAKVTIRPVILWLNKAMLIAVSMGTGISLLFCNIHN